MNTNYRITREQSQQDADVGLLSHIARAVEEGLDVSIYYVTEAYLHIGRTARFTDGTVKTSFQAPESGFLSDVTTATIVPYGRYGPELIFHVARDANSMRPGQEPERDFEVTAKFIDYVEIRSSQFSEEGGQ